MSRNNALQTIVVVLAIFASAYWIKSCGEPVTKPADYSEALIRIDSIISDIDTRDTTLIVRDSVVYHVKKTKEIIHEYHNTTDTVTKLIMCDSLAVACDSLASQYVMQDSIFREQIGDYKRVVAIQDSLLKFKPKRRWVVIPVPIPIRRR